MPIVRTQYARTRGERHVYVVTMHSRSPHKPACSRADWCWTQAAREVELGLYASPSVAMEAAEGHYRRSADPVAADVRDRRPDAEPKWTATIQRDRWTWHLDPHAHAYYRVTRKIVR